MTETETAVSVVCGLCRHGFEAIRVPAVGTPERAAWPIVFAMRFKQLQCGKCKAGWRSLTILSIHDSLDNEDLETTFEHLRIASGDKPFQLRVHETVEKRAAARTALEWVLAAVVAFAIYWILS